MSGNYFSKNIIRNMSCFDKLAVISLILLLIFSLVSLKEENKLHSERKKFKNDNVADLYFKDKDFLRDYISIYSSDSILNIVIKKSSYNSTHFDYLVSSLSEEIFRYYDINSIEQITKDINKIFKSNKANYVIKNDKYSIKNLEDSNSILIKIDTISLGIVSEILLLLNYVLTLIITIYFILSVYNLIINLIYKSKSLYYRILGHRFIINISSFIIIILLNFQTGLVPTIIIISFKINIILLSSAFLILLLLTSLIYYPLIKKSYKKNLNFSFEDLLVIKNLLYIINNNYLARKYEDNFNNPINFNSFNNTNKKNNLKIFQFNDFKLSYDLSKKEFIFFTPNENDNVTDSQDNQKILSIVKFKNFTLSYDLSKKEFISCTPNENDNVTDSQDNQDNKKINLLHIEYFSEIYNLIYSHIQSIILSISTSVATGYLFYIFNWDEIEIFKGSYSLGIIKSPLFVYLLLIIFIFIFVTSSFLLSSDFIIRRIFLNNLLIFSSNQKKGVRHNDIYILQSINRRSSRKADNRKSNSICKKIRRLT